jgi:hypothetical protein
VRAGDDVEIRSESRQTESAAVLASTAKLCNVDPERYLREAALADGRGEILLPSDVHS